MKTKSLIFTLVVGALWLGYYFFTNRSYDIYNYPSDGTAIVAFGDSLVEGVGSARGGGFVSILEDRLGEKIINLGTSGDTTKDALLQLTGVVEADPRVVIVLLGGNDAIKRIPIEETFLNLNTIIDTIHESGSSVLLVGVQGGLIGDKYKDRFKALAREKRTAFVPDILDGIISKPSLMSDGIHPNDAGYKVIADRIEPILVSLIK